jgi:hypothetical protein
MDPRIVRVLAAICIALAPSPAFAEKKTIDFIWVGGNAELFSGDATTPELRILQSQIADSKDLSDYNVVLHNYTWRGELVGNPGSTLSDFTRTSPDSLVVAGCLSWGCGPLSDVILPRNIVEYAIVHDPLFNMLFFDNTKVVIEISPILLTGLPAQVYVLDKTKTTLVPQRASVLHGKLVEWSVNNRRLLNFLTEAARLGSSTSSGGSGLESKPITEVGGDAFEALARKRYRERARTP